MSVSISQKEFRSFFEVTNHRLYFNHAAFSPLSKPVVQAMDAFFDVRQKGDPKSWSVAESHVEGLRENYGKLIGAPASRIAHMSNTVTGVNVLANGLDWHAGDHVLLYADEFPSNVMPFLNMREKGVEIEFLRSIDSRVSVDLFAKAIRPETRLISVSSVQYLTGYYANLKQLSELCQAHNILFSVDAIQSVGIIPVNVIDMGIDFMAVGGHKWMMSPLGTGFLYVTENLQAQLKLAFRGYMGHENPGDYGNFEQKLSTDARRYELGAFNAAAMVGAEKATELLLGCGIEAIYKHVGTLIGHLKDGLRSTPFIPMYDFPEHERSGIFMFTHNDPTQNQTVFEKLTAEGVNISLRGGGIRFSPHYYNSLGEVDELISLLTANN
ncbi:MAG: aminotransferase class V-fold PLP-dependent enzyme [Candidatus Marinimicrobia bacterium]|nr:aminotransferase class V-fold PLP-dependent enzyme [Candidatus Neomarinimicrobiota bacterium]